MKMVLMFCLIVGSMLSPSGTHSQASIGIILPAVATVQAGQTTSYIFGITVPPQDRHSANLSVEGLPSGATATFSEDRVTSRGTNVTLTISTSTSTPVGSYTITVVLNDNGVIATSSATLDVS